MEKNKLKQLIIEHKERFLAPADLARRECQKIIKPYLRQKEIIVISGVRRAGKSSLMKLICRDILEEQNVPADNVLYLNFEDERFIEFTHKDFELLHETFMELYQPQGRQYFFLDEIQTIKGWGRWVNRIYEFENIKIFITGSNASLLAPEIATALTGRNRQITVYPFSFSEFLSFKNYEVDAKGLYLREEKVRLKNLFRQYVESGGFPEVIKNNDTTLLEQYFKDIIYRDVIARYAIRNIREIRELALFLASNIGTIKSYQNLKELIHVKSLNTVKNYLEILENVYLFFRLDLFDYSVKRQIYNPSKIYAIDTALSSSIAFKFSQNLGHIYENITFIELLRRGHEMFYWKSKSSKEVDFLIKKGLKIDRAIQVSSDLTKSKTRQREIEGLLNAAEEFNIKNLTIITEDEEGKENIGKLNIGIIPIWKWLVVP
jgi:predicted AAA+ superfamily ATPase